MFHRIVLLISILGFLTPPLLSTPRSAGQDKGYLFAEPKVMVRTKTLKNGLSLVATHQSGVLVSENPQSPWHHASVFAQGTEVHNAQGQRVKEVTLIETVDPDGDMTLGFLFDTVEKKGVFHFIVGTGKWEDITGSAKNTGFVCQRADGYIMPRWEMSWNVDPENRPDFEVLLEEGDYPNIDHCLSFHGPHVTELTRELTNGTKLKVSNQSGVLLTEDKTAISPRNHATCFDRGTTITLPNTNGDVMLLEDTDADGDVAWLAHVWWYGKGPGTYRFLGGTGKWEGITGVGITRGMLKPRADDHFMLKSELRWKIEK